MIYVLRMVVMLYLKKRKAINITFMYDRNMDGLQMFEKVFNGVVKVQNQELTKQEKQQFHAFAECNPFLKRPLIVTYVNFL